MFIHETLYDIFSENGDCQNFCPVDCDYDSNVCQGGFDDQGCPRPDYCLSRYIAVSGQSGQLCPQYCPPICAKEDKLCPGKEFEGGCRDYSVCVPAKGMLKLNIQCKNFSHSSNDISFRFLPKW